MCSSCDKERDTIRGVYPHEAVICLRAGGRAWHHNIASKRMLQVTLMENGIMRWDITNQLVLLHSGNVTDTWEIEPPRPDYGDGCFPSHSCDYDDLCCYDIKEGEWTSWTRACGFDTDCLQPGQLAYRKRIDVDKIAEELSAYANLSKHVRASDAEVIRLQNLLAANDICPTCGVTEASRFCGCAKPAEGGE